MSINTSQLDQMLNNLGFGASALWSKSDRVIAAFGSIYSSMSKLDRAGCFVSTRGASAGRFGFYAAYVYRKNVRDLVLARNSKSLAKFVFHVRYKGANWPVSSIKQLESSAAGLREACESLGI